MRVLHVIPSVGPLRGGPSQAVLELVCALNDRGVDAEIATTNDNGPGVLDVPLGTRSKFAGAPVWFFPRFSPAVEPIREFAFSAALTRWLWCSIAKYDLIHVHAFFSYPSTIAMLIARSKRIPYLVRPLGLLCRWALQQSAFKKQIFLTLVERGNLNGSSGIEYTADLELSEAKPLGLKSPGFVLPFGLSLPEQISDARQELRRYINVQDDEPVILFLSRLHPKKGLEVLFKALEMLNRRFSLVVAGSGSADYEAQLRRQVGGSSLNGRVHFVGFAQGRFKQMLLQGADLFALTSHSESFAIAAMEAMGAGTPALVTPGVPLASIIEKFNTGWVSPLEPAAIASVITGVLDSVVDTSAARARSERCRSLAANFAWEHIAARMEEVYDSVMNRRQPPSFELNQLSVNPYGALGNCESTQYAESRSDCVTSPGKGEVLDEMRNSKS